jgi:hypothetical protein
MKNFFIITQALVFLFALSCKKEVAKETDKDDTKKDTTKIGKTDTPKLARI